MTREAYFAVIVAVVLLTAIGLRTRQRTSAMRTIAARFNFIFIGRTLPRSLTLDGTALEGITSAWNVIDGECDGARTVIFDCRVGRGKGSWRRTVIAAEEGRDFFKGVPAFLDLTVEPAPSELEGLMELLGSRDAVASLHDND